MRKKSYHPFYKATILCEIIVGLQLGLDLACCPCPCFPDNQEGKQKACSGQRR